MGTRMLLPGLLCILGATNIWATTITWDGGGGDLAWQTAANWSGNTLPGPNDDVVINIPGTATVTSSASVAIRSLQCSNDLALTAGTFQVGGGSSVVHGQLTTTGTPTLSATGALTEFRVVGSVSANGTGFGAASGAKIVLPNFTAFSRGFNCFAGLWRATGSGSELDFSGLTSLAGGTCAGLDVQASNGGVVRLPGVAALEEGTVNFLAEGGGSLIDLPALTESLGTSRPLTFEARHGGTVAMAAFKRGATAEITLNPGATLPFAQCERLGSLTVNALTADFPALTNLNEGSLLVRSGAVVTAPNLRSYLKGGSCAGAQWIVTGAGSVLDLPGLTNLTGGNCSALDMQALAGGQLRLTNLTLVAEGFLSFLADGAGSLVDLEQLGQSAAAARWVRFEARNSGTVNLPSFPGGPTVEVTLKSGGTIPFAQLQILAAFTSEGTSATLTGLTNINTGSFRVSGGAVVSAPSLTGYTMVFTCAPDFWTVNGAGSELNLPALTSLTGGGCTALTIQALNGGRVSLPSLNTLGNGQVEMLAEGAGSLVDLPMLASSLATAHAVKFEIRNGGSIEVPLLPGGPTVEVALQGAGTMPVAQMRVLRAITVDGREQSFPVLTNFTAGSFVLSNAAVVSAPALAAYDRTPVCGFVQWTVHGAGSVLDLPGLVSLTGGRCTPPEVGALAGGVVLLTNLTTVNEGRLSFLADGTNSLVDLRALQQSSATLQPVVFEARHGGTVWVPQLPGGPTVQVALKSGGILPVAQMQRLGGITVSGMNVPFPALTNLDTGFLIVSNAGMISVPNVRTYTSGSFCGSIPWTITGSGSVADLPNLQRLTGNACDVQQLRALAGGDLLLGGVTNIPAGNVGVIADGAGSLVDLHSLSSLLSPDGLSSLTATNNGMILLGDQPFLLSGVAIRAPGVLLTNRNELVLAGDAWRSYWVESRNTSSPTNPWTLYSRVPLTNDFQAIGPRAAANVEVRVWEFVADPYLLDLNRVGPALQLVLYAPTNRTLAVQAASNLPPLINWQTFATATMTNTFRIFPAAAPAAPQSYFRAQTQ